MSSPSVYIVFTKADAWWSIFLHKDISHCYLIKPDCGKWIVYGKSRMTVDLHTIDDISDIIESEHIVKAYPTIQQQSLLSLNTCVGTIKRYLGINNFILTPYQLYKHLEQNNEAT